MPPYPSEFSNIFFSKRIKTKKSQSLQVNRVKVEKNFLKSVAKTESKDTIH